MLFCRNHLLEYSSEFAIFGTFFAFKRKSVSNFFPLILVCVESESKPREQFVVLLLKITTFFVSVVICVEC